MPDSSLLPENDAPVFRPCIVLTCRDQGASLAGALAALEYLHLRALIVDDGSGQASQETIAAVKKTYSWVSSLRLQRPVGAGAALLAGLLHVAESGFTHALQFDLAAGNDPAQASLLLDAARLQPQTVISGVREDAAASLRERARRMLSHAWCMLETRSLDLLDPLCSYRVYPIAAVLALVHDQPLSSRTEFSLEVLVRLYWRGTPVVYVPVRTLPVSQEESYTQRGYEDLFLVGAHLRLTVSSLFHWRRQPVLSLHWSLERNALEEPGLRFLATCCRRLGVAATLQLLRPYAYVWSLLQARQREFSRGFLMRVEDFASQKGIAYPHSLSIAQHFLTYAYAQVDRWAVWNGQAAQVKVQFAAGAQDVLAPSADGRGKLILASHLGVIEACAQLPVNKRPATLTVITEDLSEGACARLQAHSPASLRLIAARDVNDEVKADLLARIDRGEWVAMSADRTPALPSPDGSATAGAPFLGDPALFPQEPYILAAQLRCPVVALFALVNEHNQIEVAAENFAQRITLPAAIREQSLQGYVKRYAALLERYTLKAPYNWFNFYDFWARGKGN